MSDLSDHIGSAQEFSVRATPKASRNRIVVEEGMIRVYVTVVPEAGKANELILKLLAKELGLPKSRLTLIRGETSREKTFRID